MSYLPPQQVSAGFLIDVARGRIPGFSSISKFGSNSDIDTGTTPEDVWDYGGLYNYGDDAGEALVITSSSATDTQQIEIQQLTVDAGTGDWLQEDPFEVTLNGQNQVAILPPSGRAPVRTFRMKNVGSTDLTGDVYLFKFNGPAPGGVPSVPGDVRAQISLGANQTQMAVYTIPSGKKGYLVSWGCQLDRALTTAATVQVFARPYGQVFQLKGDTQINSNGDSSYQKFYPVPLVFEAKTDLLVRVPSVTTNNTGISADFEILLEDIE